ncbi:MAG: hypothetical protein CMO81_06555 [Waddliaceae bacterium]|nr:hypothetical protein [Waddliaceae bacterium]
MIKIKNEQNDGILTRLLVEGSSVSASELKTDTADELIIYFENISKAKPSKIISGRPIPVFNANTSEKLGSIIPSKVCSLFQIYCSSDNKNKNTFKTYYSTYSMDKGFIGRLSCKDRHQDNFRVLGKEIDHQNNLYNRLKERYPNDFIPVAKILGTDVYVNKLGETKLGICVDPASSDLLDYKFSEEKDLIQVFEDIAKALAELHYLNLAHLDIKPENILLYQRLEGLRGALTDFGSTCSQEQLTFADTPLFTSPEARNLIDGKIDTMNIHQSDIWSLGLTLFETYGNHKNSLYKDFLETVHQSFYNEANYPFAYEQSTIDIVIGGRFLRDGSKASLSKKDWLEIAEQHPLMLLVLSCLSVDPQYRPTAESFLNSIQEYRQCYNDEDRSDWAKRHFPERARIEIELEPSLQRKNLYWASYQ